MASSLSENFKKSFDQIGGKYTLSWQVGLLSYFWATYISVGFDSTRLGTSKTGWFIASTLAHLALVLIALPLRKFLLPQTDRKSKPVIALLVFASFGLIRASLIGEISVLMDLAPDPDLSNRQIAGLVSFTTGLAVTTILVNAIAERQQALKELTSERAQLSEIQGQAESLFEEKRAEVLQIIDESIKPSLEEINQALSGEIKLDSQVTQQTTNLISALIDDRLRPISDALHKPAAFNRGDKDWSSARSPIVRLDTKISVQSLISPVLVSVIMSALTISGSIYYAGYLAVFVGASIYLPFLLLATLGKRLIPENWKLNFWLALPLTVLAHVGAGFPSFFIIRRLDTTFNGIAQQFNVAIIGFALTSFLIAVFRGMESERKSFEDEFKHANDEASAVLANLNQRIWLSRKNTAQLLHGSVQASLTAANLRLRQESLTEQDLQKVRDDIARAINSLTDDPQSEFDLEGSLEDLIDLWDGVCDIEISIAPETIELLDRDLTAGYCVNEFLKECVNNAIKHGSATEINVDISILNNSMVHIAVLNNGEFKSANQAGLGTRILDEITSTWERKQTAFGTQVSGQIAMAVVPQPAQN